jgi:hypothetical protein
MTARVLEGVLSIETISNCSNSQAGIPLRKFVIIEAACMYDATFF